MNQIDCSSVVALPKPLDPYVVRAGETLLDLSAPVVMGILNVTPDSFFAGSRKQSETEVAERAAQVVQEGGTILDIGACSTRPGATLVSQQEEIERLRHALRIIRQNHPHLLLSVDTYRADVAKMAVEEFGVEMINDISGGQGDKQMFATMSQLPAAYILMHLHRSVEEMHQVPHYEQGVEYEVARFLVEQVDQLRSAGVTEIILDPGYGFSKSLEDHYRLALLQRYALDPLELPVLVGVSRKRMVQQVAQVSAEDAKNGTNILHSFFLWHGMAHIIRTHDVKEAVEAIRIVQKLQETGKCLAQTLPKVVSITNNHTPL